MAFNAYGRVFSEIYDMFWDDFSPSYSQIMKLLESSTLKNRSVLDLFCGTGRLTHKLLEAGYQVIGIDSSEHMLSIARNRNKEFIEASKASFVLSEATSFTLDSKVSVVLATYDSINHLPDILAFQKCMSSIWTALDQGGLLIFDLNTKRGLKSWNFIDLEDGDDVTFVMHGKYDGDSDQAYTKVIGFKQRDDDWYEKFEEIMFNTIFKLEDIKDQLLAKGFNNVYFTKENDLFRKINEPEKELRVFVIAQKPED
ncbi:MAG: class I SAM-dependent DNA methyltransferase [Candidatus Kariarchaeaceae archaeon]|jgi:SAM-dependent methyltransferase